MDQSNQAIKSIERLSCVESKIIIFRIILITLFNKPENILVSYQMVDDKVTNFEMVVADWGSAQIGTDGGRFFGGTPVYAGPGTFNASYKDFFSFGRMAMELFMDKSGTESKTKNEQNQKIVSKLIRKSGWDSRFIQSKTSQFFECFGSDFLTS